MAWDSGRRVAPRSARCRMLLLLQDTAPSLPCCSGSAMNWRPTCMLDCYAHFWVHRALLLGCIPG